MDVEGTEEEDRLRQAEGPEGPFVQALYEIEYRLGLAGPEEFADLAEDLAGMERELDRPPLSDSLHLPALRAALLTARGHVARIADRHGEAVSFYDGALQILGDSPEGRSLRQRANLWTCRSLALLSAGDRASMEEARRSCDRAIELRRWPEAESRSNRWGQAAAWLNRADALGALGDEDSLAEAVRSCEEARRALEDFDPASGPAIRTRWALSWMKQGDLEARRVAASGGEGTSGPLACYGEAVTLLRPGAEEGAEESRRVLAVALANRSRWRLLGEGKGSPAGVEEAREGLRWLGPAEASDRETLSLGVTLRILLACHLEDAGEEEERFLEITDLVEEGLSRLADFRGKTGIFAVEESVLGDLVRLGAESYLHASPRFLADYLLDLLDPERGGGAFAGVAEVHEAAVRVLWRGIARIQREGFADIRSEAYEVRRELLAQWEACRERLAEVRRIYFEIS